MPDTQSVDLNRIARQAMLARGFQVDFSAEALSEAQNAAEPDFQRLGTRDLTAFLWSSIDNDDSKDLDQIEYSETIAGGTRVYIAIADVNALVRKDSAVDRYARQNTTSVYTGVTIFPMLPKRFSTDLTSLNESCKRMAVVTEMQITDTGEIASSTVYPAVVMNKAQLTYDGVRAWLDKITASPGSRSQQILDKIGSNPQLQQQLLMQDRASQILRERRRKEGALDFETAKLAPTVVPGGKIELSTQEQNRASHIIEEFMIASNECVDAFLQSKNIPSLQRVVRTPKNWPRMAALAAERGTKLPIEPDAKALQAFLASQQKSNPEEYPDLSLAMIKLLGRGEYVVKRPGQTGLGHFGLAAANYSHTTAPNRRYPDLVMQRLLEAAFRGAVSPYSSDELDALASYCTTKEDDANRVERQVTKSMAAVSLSTRLGEAFDGIITGASEKGVFIRLSAMPIEGKVYGKTNALEVGMHVKVKLVRTDPERGFIDFEIL